MPTNFYSQTGEDKDRIHLHIVRGDTDTSPDERHFLKSVEKGDFSSVQNFLEESAIYFNININCVDALGRTGLIIAIENENMDIIELLLSYNVELGDALLFAIEEEVPQAVEILLTYRVPKASKKDQMALMNGGKKQESNFTPDITPVILAAHTNNYEILKTLISRGATIVKPHGVKCSCYECVRSATFDSLRHSQTRMNAYRALASPCLMILCSDDPFLTAFELSWELHHLSYGEVEFKEEYQRLSHQCSKFAVDLLDQTRGSQELKTILNRTTDPIEILEMEDETGESEKENMNLSRFKLAIEYKQKQFVSHPNCQQLLSHMWYQGIPGWKQGSMAYKLGFTLLISFTFPLTSLLYILFPFMKSTAVLKNPFVKFINHSASYVMFLVLLVLASTDFFNDSNIHNTRSRPPNIPEWIIVTYVLAFIWNEMKEIYDSGFIVYSSDLWNIMDFIQNALYLATISLRLVVFFGEDLEIGREEMTSADPMLVAEGLFAVANISSTLRLLFLFTANSQLGPLQISLGRMIIDIVKFLFIFLLVLISFASGMNQLLFLEYRYTDAGNADKGCVGVTCDEPNNEFSSIYHSMVSLFWTVMGTVDLKAISVNTDHAFTDSMAMVMYLVYHIIAIVVLLNMLIAMMNLSYEQIEMKSDNEWKFSRSRLWMSYFEDGKTVPPPFNIIISPKSVYKFIHKIRTLCVSDLQELKKRQKATKLQSKMRELERKYQDSMTNLTQRYIANLKKSQDYEPVTEDDLNEIKQDISAFRYEVIELLRRNIGEDTSTVNSRNESGRRTINATKKKSTLKTSRKSVVAANLQNGSSVESQGSSNDLIGNGKAGGRLVKVQSAEKTDESNTGPTKTESTEAQVNDNTYETTFSDGKVHNVTSQYMHGNINNTVNTNLITNTMMFKMDDANGGVGYTMMPAYYDNSHHVFQQPFVLVQSTENPNEFRVRPIPTLNEDATESKDQNHMNCEDVHLDSEIHSEISSRRPSIASIRSINSRRMSLINRKTSQLEAVSDLPNQSAKDCKLENPKDFSVDQTDDSPESQTPKSQHENDSIVVTEGTKDDNDKMTKFIDETKDARGTNKAQKSTLQKLNPKAPNAEQSENIDPKGESGSQTGGKGGKLEVSLSIDDVVNTDDAKPLIENKNADREPNQERNAFEMKKRSGSPNPNASSKYPQGYTEYQGIKFLPPKSPKFTQITLSGAPNNQPTQKPQVTKND